MDVKRNIHDLAVNKYGSTIAVVENNGDYDSVQESVVRLYNVGRKKNVEDEVEDEDDESEGSEDGTISDTESVEGQFLIKIGIGSVASFFLTNYFVQQSKIT